MYNATNAATWLWAPQRFATRLRVLRRASIQLNDLFVNLLSRFGSTRLNSACLIAPQFNATICLLLRDFTLLRATQCRSSQRNATICLSIYYRTAALRSAPLCIVSLLGSSPCVAPQHIATLLNDLFVTTQLRSAPLLTTRLGFWQRTSTLLNDLFVTPRRNVAYSIAALFNSTQRFVCQFIIAPRHGSRQRTAAQLGLPRRAATQLNELKLN